jgi:hypothetical protein
MMGRVERIDFVAEGVWMILLPHPAVDSTLDIDQAHRAFLSGNAISVVKTNAKRIMELIPAHDTFPVKVMATHETGDFFSIDVSKQAVTKAERKQARRLYTVKANLKKKSQKVRYSEEVYFDDGSTGKLKSRKSQSERPKQPKQPKQPIAPVSPKEPISAECLRDALALAAVESSNGSTVDLGCRNGCQVYIPVYNQCGEEVEEPDPKLDRCSSTQSTDTETILESVPKNSSAALAHEYTVLLQDMVLVLEQQEQQERASPRSSATNVSVSTSMPESLSSSGDSDMGSGDITVGSGDSDRDGGNSDVVHFFRVQLVMEAKEHFPHHGMGTPASILLHQLFRLHQRPDTLLGTAAVVKRYAPLLRSMLGDSLRFCDGGDGSVEEEEEELLDSLYSLEREQNERQQNERQQNDHQPEARWVDASDAAPDAASDAASDESPFIPIPANCLENLYHEGVIAEDTVLSWWANNGHGTGLERHQAFVHWLQNAEEEDDDEEGG